MCPLTERRPVLDECLLQSSLKRPVLSLPHPSRNGRFLADMTMMRERDGSDGAGPVCLTNLEVAYAQ